MNIEQEESASQKLEFNDIVTESNNGYLMHFNTQMQGYT